MGKTYLPSFLGYRIFVKLNNIYKFLTFMHLLSIENNNLNLSFKNKNKLLINYVRLY